MGDSSQTYTLPVLPLKNTVCFPGLAMPITIQDTSAVKAVDVALASETKRVALFVQKNVSQSNPAVEDLYSVGTTANITVVARFGPTLQVILQSLERIEVVHFIQSQPFLKAQVQPSPVDRKSVV